MPKSVFYDPEQKRWTRIRRLLDVLGVALTLLLIFFGVTIFRGTKIPDLQLPQQKRSYRALIEKERKHSTRRGTHRRTRLKPTQVPMNSGESLRAAFYVTWDAASYSSLRENIHQLDLVFPEWLHVLTADGHLQAVTELNTLYPVFTNGKPAQIDPKVMAFIRQENADVEVLPLVNNFDPISNEWRQEIGDFLASPDGRKRFREETMAFLASDKYRGLTLDLEGFPEKDQPGYRALISELATDLHNRGMKLYISVPVANPDFDYAYMSKFSDGLILMNYDQHYPGGEPGAIASQDWFTHNLEQAIKVIPRNKIMCAIGNYGYDWTTIRGKKPFPTNAHTVSVQEAWIEARDAESDIHFDDDAFNPHFTYLDDDNFRHDVWYLDGVTALNEMRAARELGIQTFALWRLGSEDRSLWQIWDKPFSTDPEALAEVPPGQDVDMEGGGEILKIENKPASGRRTIEVDKDTGLIDDESFTDLPVPYRIGMYGRTDKEVAITFDDGPDPTWTPKMLDVLKREHAPACFFLIGLQAEKFGGLTKRIYDEGHEIGNHTFTHPDISAISDFYMKVELNLTERFFAGKLGVKPLLFRPPYSIDQEPDTADEVKPLQLAQDLGYITVGDKIDPDDWRDNPRPTPEEITQSVISQLGRGNVILLHDGGGDRHNTVAALPMIIHELRARGYRFVSVSDLLDKKRSDVMPPLKGNERIWAKVDAAGFTLFGFIQNFIIFVFFVGDILMTGRLLFIGTLAVYDRFRRRKMREPGENPDYQPKVAVLVPAYNEEKVIERTVRSVLESDYPKLRIIVIDDGSSDATYEVAQTKFAAEIASGKVVVLTHRNGGKASALNFGLQYVTEEIFVGIDADTIIAPDAIKYLVPHFQDEKIGALAGNAKVGNRVNLWTRWQALEYITSQNFERRALDAFSAVSVVPGAIGAWRTAAVRAAGGYHSNTVAEDADLTMALLQNGYKVEYEDRALAYTEAPHTANGLMRQRFRWSFGILQATWKHRSAFLRGGALGWFALPNTVIFQILLPIVSPFIDIMFLVGAGKYLLWDKYFHPETADPASFHQLVVFFAVFMIIDFIASTIAFMLERSVGRRNRDWLLLAHVWLQRFAYRQLFSVVLIKTLKRAIQGGAFSWDKLDRTATVKAPNS